MSIRDPRAANEGLKSGGHWRDWRCSAPAGRLAQDGRELFVHLQYCVQQKVFSKYPWLELRGVLHDLAPDPTA